MLSRSVMSDSVTPIGLQPARLLCRQNFPGENSGVVCHFLLQEICPTQGLNPGLQYYRWILYHLSHKGSPQGVSFYSKSGIIHPQHDGCIIRSFHLSFKPKASFKNWERSFHRVWRKPEGLCNALSTCYLCIGAQFSSVQSFNHVQLFVTPRTTACQASLSITQSQSLLKLMAIQLVLPSNHLILCHAFLLLLSNFPSIRVFSNESVLHIRKPKYQSFSFSISPANEYSGLISFMID